MTLSNQHLAADHPPRWVFDWIAPTTASPVNERLSEQQDLHPPSFANVFANVDESVSQPNHPVVAGLIGRVTAGRDATLISVRVGDVRCKEAGDFTAAVTSAYRWIAEHRCDAIHRHVVRMWNCVPGIHDRLGVDLDRYMAFNEGRYSAIHRLLNCSAGEVSVGDDGDQQNRVNTAILDNDAAIPAASGVGGDGDDFAVHALLMGSPGRAVHNPLQRPTVQYSRRYGPSPPCFARGTIVKHHGRKQLFVSGTAAILGEQSMHADDLSAQFELTLRNLRAVVAAGGISSESAALAAFRSLRVYVPPAADLPWIEAAVRERFAAEVDVEFVPADLCRQDLLVEIEGVACGDETGTRSSE